MDSLLSPSDPRIQAHLAALEQQPGHHAALDALTAAFGEANQWDALLQILEREIARVGDARARGELYYRAGHVWEERVGNRQLAMRYYQLASRANPAARTPLLAAERVYRELGQWPMVARLLELQVEAESDAAEKAALWCALGQVQREQLGDAARAAYCFAEALGLEPDRAEAQEALSALQESSANFESVAAELRAEAAATDEPALRASLYLQAAEVVHRENRGAPSVEADLRLARKDDPDNPRAAELLTELYAWQGRFEELSGLLRARAEAEADAERRIALLTTLAHHAAQRGDESSARKAFEDVLAIDAAQPDALAALLPIWRRTRDHEALLAHAERLATASAGPEIKAPVLREAAEVAWRDVGDRPRARVFLDALGAVAPHDPLLRAVAAEPPKPATPAEYKSAHTALAQKARTAASPEAKREAFRTLARLAEAHGQTPKEAIDAWRGVLDADKTDVEAQRHLRALYRRGERWHALVEQLKHAVDQTPEERVEDRVALFEEMADVYGNHLSMEPMVVNTLQSLLALVPSHRPTLERLAAIYERRENWGQLADVLGRKADATDARDEKLALLHRSAELWLNRLQSPEDAIKRFEQILGQDPADARALAALRKIYEQRRAYEPLVQVYLRELDTLPTDEERLRRAREVAEWAQKHLHRPARLIELWNKVLQYDPSDGKALAALASLYEREERYPALTEILQRQIAETADKRARVLAMKKLGQLFADKLQREDLAVATWQSALDDDPDNADVFKILRDRYVKAKRWEDLEALYARRGKWEEYVDVLVVQAEALPDGEEKVRVYFQIAQVWQEKLQRADRAARVYERVLEIDPRNPKAAQTLEPVFEKSAEWRKLTHVAEVLAELEPDAKTRADKRRRISQIYEEKLRKPAEAFAAAARAMEDDPSQDGLVDKVQSLAEVCGAHEEAALAFERARLHAESLEGRVDLGLRAARLHDARADGADEAIAAYEGVRADDSANEEAHAALLRLFEAGGHWRKLLALREAELDRALDEAARERTRFAIAQLQEQRLGELDQAIASYEAILTLRHDAREALEALARLYQRQERPKELAQTLEKRLELAVDGPERAPLLAHLGELAMGPLADPALAVERYRALLEVAPEDEDATAVEALETLRVASDAREAAAELLATRYRARGSHEALLPVLETLIECAADGGTRYALLLEAGRTCEVHLRRIDAAYDLYARAFQEDPSDERAFAELDRLAPLLDHERAFAELLAAGLERIERTGHRARLAARAGALFSDLDQRAEAIAALTAALDLGLPDDEARAAMQKLGRLYDLQSDWVNLKAILERALEHAQTASERKGILLRRGALLEERLDAPADAAQSYREALILDADDETALERLDVLYARSRDYERLADVLAAKLRNAKGPGQRAGLHLRLGHVLAAELARTHEALAEFRAVLEIDPDSDDAVTALEALVDFDAELQVPAAEILAPIYERRGDQDKVRLALEALLPARPPEERVEILLRVGNMSEESGNAERAYDAYVRALREGPGNGETRARLTRLADAQQRWPQLLETFEAALPEIAETGDALATLSTMARAADEKLGDAERALSCYGRMLDIEPENPLAFDQMGALFERGGRMADLVALIERREGAVLDVAEQERLAMRRGELLSRELGQRDRAIEAFRKAEALAPERTEILDALEALYDAEARHEDVVRVHLRRAELSTVPAERRERILYAAAILESPLSEPDRAIELYRRLVDLDATDREPLLALARLYEAQSDPTSLLGVLELLVESTPDADERLALRHRIASLVEGPLGDPGRAIELYEAILADAPTHAGTLAALEGLAASSSERLRAARVLVPLYASRGEHAAFVRAAEVELSETEEPAGRIALLRRIARTREENLGERALALAAYRQALQASTELDPPVDEEVLAHVERLANEDGAHDTLAEVYREVLASVSDPNRGKLIAHKLAKLYDAVLLEPEEAISEYRRVLALDPKDQPALAALDRLYEKAARHPELCEVLRREIELSDDPEEVVTLNYRLGVSLAEHLQDPPAAVAAFAAALDFDDKHAPTLAALRAMLDARQEVPAIAALVGPLYRKREAWAEVAHLLEVEHEVATEPAERKRLALVAAELHEEKLGSYHAAFGFLAHAFREDPSDRDTTAELTRVAGEAESWDALASVLDEERGRVEDATTAERLALEVASLHLVHLGDRDGATLRYEEVLETNPRSTPALRALDRIYTETGDHDRLTRILGLEAECAKDKADELGYRLRLAETQERLCADVDGAITTYRAVLDDTPDQAQAIDALERIYRDRDEAEPLYEIYERRLALVEEDAARVPLLSAMAVLAAERLDRETDAIELWLEVEKLGHAFDSPAAARALRALERLYDQTGRYAELAEVLGRRAEAEGDPRARADIEARRAEVYADRLGLSDEAVLCWCAVLALRPQDEAALSALTELYRSARRYPELAQTLATRADSARARDASPDERIALLSELAQVQSDSLMSPDAAIASWHAVLELEPANAVALDALEQLHGDQGDFERVTEIVRRRAALVGTEEARIHSLFAIAELRDRRMNDPEGAAALYEEILEANPDDARASELLEALYERIGNHERVAELLLGRLENVEAAWDRLSLLRRIADIYLEKLARSDMAFIVLCRAVREDPRDEALLAEVERLARETGSTEELVYLFEEMIGATEDPVDRAPLHATVARYYDEELRRPDLAVAHYHRLLETDPTNGPALDALEALLRREGRLQELADILARKAERAVELHERKAHLFALAEVCEGPLDEPNQATAALEEILRLDEAEEAALVSLARIYRRVRRWSDLIRVLDRQISLTYDPPAVLALRRDVATILDRELGDAEAAADVYREILASDPGDADAVANLERILTIGRRWEELVHLLSEQVPFAATATEAAELHEKLGALWEDHLGRPDRAVEAYRAILRVAPRQGHALAALERLHAARGEWTDLTDVLERQADAADNDEVRAGALRRLGQTYQLRLSDDGQAAAAYQRVLELLPNDAETLDSLAGIFENAGDYRQSADLLERAAAAHVERRLRAEGWHRVAVIAHEHLDDHERAAGALRNAMASDPTFVPALTTMRQLASERGDWREVLSLLHREDEQTFDHRRKVDLACEMGRVARDALGDNNAAISFYELAQERAPESPESAEPLANLYYARGDYGRARALLEIVRRKAPEGTGGGSAAETRYRLADASLRAGDETAALTYFQEAYDADVTHLPTLVALGELLFRRGEFERAFKVYQSIVVHHSESRDINAVDVYYKLGVVRHRLGERRKAIHSFDKALELDPSHVPTLRALAAAYEEKDEWEEAVEVRKRLVDAVTEPAERLELAVSIGDIYRERLGQRARAVTAYTDALDASPGDLVILHKLLELYTEGKEWLRAIDVLEQIAARERDPEALSTYAYSIAVIARDELKDADAAIAAFNRTLDVNPSRLKAFEAIDKLLTQRRDWPALAVEYRRMLERIGEESAAQLRLALWRGLGEIYRSRLKSFAEAIPCFEHAAALAPNDLELRVILAELYETHSDTYAQALEIHRALVAADPGRFPSYHAMHRLHRARGEHDRAYWLCNVLRYLGQLDQEEFQYFEQVRQVAPKRPGRPLDERAWHYVLHPDEDPVLGRIFALLAGPIAPLYLVNPKDLGIKKKDRIETGDLQIFFSRIFQLSRGVLGVAPPEVYLKADGAGLSLMNTAPVTLLVGPDMVQDRPEPELAFALAKNLSYLRPEHFLSALLPPLADTVFYAGVRACFPTQKLPADRDAKEIDELAKRIKKALPPTAMAQLQTLLQQFYQQGRHFDAAHWLASIEHTGNRAGFLVSGDLVAAEHIIQRETVAISQVPRQDKLRALLEFSLSEDYFLLRGALELAVKA